MTLAIVAMNPTERLSSGNVADRPMISEIERTTSGHYLLKDLEPPFDLLRYSRFQAALCLFAELFTELTVFDWQNEADTPALGNDHV